MAKVERPGEIYFRLAVLLRKKQERNESVAYIKKVLELDPNNADARIFWDIPTPSRRQTG